MDEPLTAIKLYRALYSLCGKNILDDRGHICGAVTEVQIAREATKSAESDDYMHLIAAPEATVTLKMAVGGYSEVSISLTLPVDSQVV